MNKTKTRTLIPLLFFCTLINLTNAQWVSVGPPGNLPILSLNGSGINIFAGAGNLKGIFLSTNNGQNWAQTSLNNLNISSIAISGNNIFAACNGVSQYNGVYFSTNNGLNWVLTSLNNIVNALAASGNYVFAGLAGNLGVWFSTNNGVNWMQTSANNQTINVLLTNGSNIYAGTLGHGVFVSTNYGQSWSGGSLTSYSVFSLTCYGIYIFAGLPSMGVYYSTNNGLNWTQTNLNNQSINTLVSSGNNIFAGTSNGVFYSSNNGSNWTQRNEGLGNITVNSMLILANYIFAGTLSNSVFIRPLSDFIGIKIISTIVPDHFFLYQNYPNPFNPTTKIKFSLLHPPEGGKLSVKLIVYNVLGKEIASLIPSDWGGKDGLDPGTYEASFDGSNYPSGVYFYRLTATSGEGSYSDTKRMILLK